MKRTSPSPAVRRSVYRQNLGRCSHCLGSLRTRGFHVDHRWPLAHGGTNLRRNLQPLCAPCNLRKGATIPWAQLLVRQMGYLVGTFALLHLISGLS